MWTNNETVAAGHSIDPARWRQGFEAAMGRIAGRFARYEPRLRAGRLVLGLLSDLPRKNCWVRHEAPCDRVGVEDLYRRAVAAAG